jgi:hypothetical protein
MKGGSIVKKVALFMITLTLVLVCGCSAWMNGSYASVIPHKEQNFQPEQTLVTPKDYEDIEQILVGMIRNGQQTKTISLEKMGDNWRKIVSDAVRYVTDIFPLGAYAVLDIDYDIGTSGMKPALALEITYRRSIADIGAVQNVETEEDIASIIHEALQTYDLTVAFSIEDYHAIDFDQIVRDYALFYPQYVMEVPRVSAMMYPQNQPDRIVELTFHYDTSRTSMRQMQQQVDRIFSAAEIYVSGEGTGREKYELLYSFLINRFNYTEQTSITPAYSLLHHGVGDNKAFASVYAAMCRQAGLECQVITGTRAGQAWNWNLIVIDDTVYHLDLLRCRDSGRFFYREAQTMTDYVWDYSAY